MRAFKKYIPLLLLLPALACKPEADPIISKPQPELKLPFEAQYDLQSLEFTDDFKPTGKSQGPVTALTEVSGLAASYANPSYLWCHEDSGNDNQVYLLSKAQGKLVASYSLNGAQNIDWEDMAIGPGPKAGIYYLYLADIGNNNALRSTLAIYRVPEPTYQLLDSGKIIGLANVEKLQIAYPDSGRDAEAILVDPLTKDIFIVTKWEDRARLYRAAYPQPLTGVDTLQLIGTFPFTQIVAGDVSQDGSRVLLKSYPAIFYWKKQADEPLINLLSKTPKRAPYDPIEFQGEAICWDGSSYFTLSEKIAGFTPKLYFYGKK